MNTQTAKRRLTGTKCFYCKIEFDNSKWRHKTVDHKQAVKKGGQDVLENYVLCCKKCNVLKGTKSVEEFLKFLDNK